MPPLERGHNVKKYVRQEQQLAQAAEHARQLHEPESIARWHERHLIRSASLKKVRTDGERMTEIGKTKIKRETSQSIVE
jgi:hypothetical protein